MTILSIYDSRWTNYYYLFMPVSHGFIVSLKALNLALKLSDKLDLAVIWSAFVMVAGVVNVLFLRLTKTQKYRQHFDSKLEKIDSESEHKHINYKLAFRVVRSESISIFLSFFIAFIIYPGVFFDSIVSLLTSVNRAA